MCVGQSKKGAVNSHQVKKPGVRVKEIRGSIQKVLCGCKRPEEVSRISVWVSETRGDIPNFCVGVRDPGRYPKFMCECKRPMELSGISMWV